MRKAILMMLLAVVSSSAAAEWVEIGSNGSATAYADPSASSKAINIVKIPPIVDTFHTPIPEPSTLALLGISLAGLGFSRRKKT